MCLEWWKVPSSELKEDTDTTTWFKDHSTVFTDPAQLGEKSIAVTETMKTHFLQEVYRPYLQSVIDHIRGRIECTDLISSMAVFDPRHLPDDEDNLSDYGMDKINTLTAFYGFVQEVQFDGKKGISQPDIDPEDTESEWKLFRRLMLVQHKSLRSSLQQVLSALLSSSASFPNLAKLAAILIVLPVTTATVERTFSSMKLIKTRLRSRMGENTLEHTMRICIEGPDRLSNETLEAVIDHYKHSKQRRIML